MGRDEGGREEVRICGVGADDPCGAQLRRLRPVIVASAAALPVAAPPPPRRRSPPRSLSMFVGEVLDKFLNIFSL